MGGFWGGGGLMEGQEVSHAFHAHVDSHFEGELGQVDRSRGLACMHVQGHAGEQAQVRFK